MLSVRDIRDRVVAQVVGTLGPDGWTLSRHAYETLPDHLGTAAEAHQTFAVAVPSTTFLAGRQARGAPQHVATDLRVRWLYRLRVEDHDGDLAAALDAEVAIFQAVLGTLRDAQLRIALDGDMTRRVLGPDAGPLLLGEIPFTVHHQLALSAS